MVTLILSLLLVFNYFKFMDLHIGNEIKRVFENSDLSAEDFANKIGMVRQNIYKIFNKSDINTGLLKNISITLNHDFFTLYAHSIFGENKKIINRIKELEKNLSFANHEIEYLKEINSILKS